VALWAHELPALGSKLRPKQRQTAGKRLRLLFRVWFDAMRFLRHFLINSRIALPLAASSTAMAGKAYQRCVAPISFQLFVLNAARCKRTAAPSAQRRANSSGWPALDAQATVMTLTA
jgi:hypothetical protein